MSIELVRSLFLTRLKQPGDYSDKPAQALVLFCGQYLQSMLYGPSVQMCRISMAESERFPEQAALYFDVLFTQVQARLSAYLKTTFCLTTKGSADAANSLLGQVLFPRFSQVLFGLDPPVQSLHPEVVLLSPDLKQIRNAVSELLDSFAR